MAWMGIPDAALTWQFKDTEPFIYRSCVGDTDMVVAERKCCRNCGCNISLQYYLYPEKTHVAASTADANSFEPLKVGCHIWTKSLPTWYSIPDDSIPRYHEFDEDFQAKLEEWLKVKQQHDVQKSSSQSKGGWWAGMLPGDAPDYTAIDGPDTTTMEDLWNDPSRVKKPSQYPPDTAAG